MENRIAGGQKVGRHSDFESSTSHYVSDYCSAVCCITCGNWCLPFAQEGDAQGGWTAIGTVIGITLLIGLGALAVAGVDDETSRSTAII